MRFIQAAIWFVLLGGFCLPASASERFPTEQELQQLTQQFKQRVPQFQNDQTVFCFDTRTASDRQQLASFVNAWSKVDSGAAPFLGSWASIEGTKSIYPSRTPGKVCVIDSFTSTDGFGLSFSLGQVTNGTIRTDDRTILMRQGNFLVSTFVYDQKPGLHEYGNHRTVENPEKVEYFRKEPEIIQQFEQAGCTANLPK